MGNADAKSSHVVLLGEQQLPGEHSEDFLAREFLRRLKYDKKNERLKFYEQVPSRETMVTLRAPLLSLHVGWVFSTASSPSTRK